MNLRRYFTLMLAFSFSASYAQQPNTILNQTKAAIGLNNLKKPLLHYYYNEVSLHGEQSDRWYPPFFTISVTAEAWLNPDMNTTYIKSAVLGVGSGTGKELNTYYVSPSKFYFTRDTSYFPNANFAEYDKLNAWTVVLDWVNDPTVKQVKNEVYREYDRLVFERPALVGNERLYIDPKTYFPVKLDYEERSSLWGQRHIEIIYNIWQSTENSSVSTASFRLEDGEPTVYRTIGKSELCDSAALFARVKQLKPTSAKNFNNQWYSSDQPVLTKISDQTYTSKNNYYTETFTKIGNVVYILDATLSEERAKQDEKLINQVFPGISRFVVVVTDLAWPHIGGVRYWVSKGATIVSHAASKPFLEKVVNRTWTLQPDELQKHPQKMKFIGVDKLSNLAGGKLLTFPIDGIGSEGALACYLTDDRLLWASDYIQDASGPSSYAKEVINAVNREKLKPVKMIAEHLPITDWQQILNANPM